MSRFRKYESRTYPSWVPVIAIVGLAALDGWFLCTFVVNVWRMTR